MFDLLPFLRICMAEPIGGPIVIQGVSRVPDSVNTYRLSIGIFGVEGKVSDVTVHWVEGAELIRLTTMFELGVFTEELLPLALVLVNQCNQVDERFSCLSIYESEHETRGVNTVALAAPHALLTNKKQRETLQRLFQITLHRVVAETVSDCTGMNIALSQAVTKS